MGQSKANDLVADALISITNGIQVEVLRQLEMWGVEFDDRNTANDWCAYICRYVAEGAYDGRKSQYSPERFRICLGKAAALCISAIMAMDRNGQCAPRHYEGLPNAGASEKGGDTNA